ncbi:hypothetical protein Tco_0039824 [Tanacetum coccineum]
MLILSQISLACNSIVLKDVLSIMFENDNDIDLKLVSDMHTTLDAIGMRIRLRGELILEVEKQGYSPEVYESLKLLKDLQETDNAKARSFMRVINETEIKIHEKISLVVQFHYILQKQVFVDDAHYDMPLIYNVEGDVKFVSRVLPHKLGLKVTNLDLLGVIEDEELFGKLVDDDAVRVCLLLALEVIFMGKKLVDEVPDTLMCLVENLEVWNDFRWGENYVPTYTLSGFVWSFKILETFKGSHNWWNRDLEIIPRGVAWSRKQLFKRSDYSLLFGKDSTVNLDLTPTKSEHQSNWYKFFREYYTAYIPRSAPTRYPDLFDDYLKKLAASHKRGKLDTRDLPIIRRCDTTSVEEIRVRDCVIFELNYRVYKLETIIKVLGHERKGVLLTSFIDNRPAENGLDYDDDLVKKRRHNLMNSDHWKVYRSKITNGKISQRSGAFSAYYWGDTFVNAEKDRPLNALNDQDMTQFLKDVTPWVKVFS